MFDGWLLVRHSEAGALAVLLTSVHAETRSSCTVAPWRLVTLMSRALRQGCPVAPIIFAAWTARLHRKVREALGILGRRMRSDCYSMLADDLHAHWLLRDVAGFTEALTFAFGRAPRRLPTSTAIPGGCCVI